MTDSDEEPGNVDKEGSEPIRISEDKEAEEELEEENYEKKMVDDERVQENYEVSLTTS